MTAPPVVLTVARPAEEVAAVLDAHHWPGLVTGYGAATRVTLAPGPREATIDRGRGETPVADVMRALAGDAGAQVVGVWSQAPHRFEPGAGPQAVDGDALDPDVEAALYGPLREDRAGGLIAVEDTDVDMLDLLATEMHVDLAVVPVDGWTLIGLLPPATGTELLLAVLADVQRRRRIVAFGTDGERLSVDVLRRRRGTGRLWGAPSRFVLAELLTDQQRLLVEQDDDHDGGDPVELWRPQDATALRTAWRRPDPTDLAEHAGRVARALDLPDGVADAVVAAMSRPRDAATGLLALPGARRVTPARSGPAAAGRAVAEGASRPPTPWTWVCAALTVAVVPFATWAAVDCVRGGGTPWWRLVIAALAVLTCIEAVVRVVRHVRPRGRGVGA